MTDQEINQALFSINDLKAPGIDGFNSHFFKQSWSIIGHDVTDAVKDFFQSGFMPL